MEPWHQPLSGFLTKLSRVSRQSDLSANDKDDNELIWGAVHRSPGIYLTAEECGLILPNEVVG